MKITRFWQWLLAASGVVGSIILIVEQAEQIGGWVGEAAGTVSEGAASLYYRIGSAREKAAASAAKAYHASEVCIGTVDTIDLDGDGFATDFIARYIDYPSLAENDPPLTCDDYRSATDMVNDKFLIAKGKGFSHQVIGSFDAFQQISTVGSLVMVTYAMTDFPSTTVYGYQGGQLAEIRSFEHMLSYGNEDDEEIEVWDVMPTAAGVRLRTPDGLFDIVWNAETQAYTVAQIGWETAKADNLRVLYVQRPTDGAETDAVLMLDGSKLADAESVGQTVTMNIGRLARILFDPRCLVEGGFKEIPNLLSAVAVDSQSKEHVFSCVLYPDGVITVRVDES